MNRRSFLSGAGAVAFSGRLAIPAPVSSEKALKVVVVGGHPGDPEYGCGGTVARYVEQGSQVTLVYLNRGQRGCGNKSLSACADVRTSEGRTAGQILGASVRFAEQIDGDAVVTSDTYGKFFTLLEAEKPDVVFTHWPIDNHRDHRAAFNLTYDSWLRAKKRFGLYFYEVSDGEDTIMFSPTDYVDIGKQEGKKRSACFAHASQSPERFYALQSQIARFRGTESGHEQAEAFIRHRESAGHLLP